jgi:hypothetical protein
MSKTEKKPRKRLRLYLPVASAMIARKVLPLFSPPPRHPIAKPRSRRAANA